MRLPLPLLLIFLAPAFSLAQVSVQTPGYKLALGEDWAQVPCPICQGEDQLSFISKRNRADLRVAFFTGIGKLPADRLEQVGEKFLALMIQQERKNNPSASVSIAKSWVENHPRGLRLNYFGNDSRGRSFRYAGFFVECKHVFIHIETETPYEKSLEILTASVLVGLEF